MPRWGAVGKVVQAVADAPRNVARETTKGCQQVEAEAKRAKERTAAELERVRKQAAAEAKRAQERTAAELERVRKQAAEEAERVRKQAEQAGRKLHQETAKACKQVQAELKRAGDDCAKFIKNLVGQTDMARLGRCVEDVKRRYEDQVRGMAQQAVASASGAIEQLKAEAVSELRQGLETAVRAALAALVPGYTAVLVALIVKAGQEAVQYLAKLHAAIQQFIGQVKGCHGMALLAYVRDKAEGDFKAMEGHVRSATRPFLEGADAVAIGLTELAGSVRDMLLGVLTPLREAAGKAAATIRQAEAKVKEVQDKARQVKEKVQEAQSMAADLETLGRDLSSELLKAVKQELQQHLEKVARDTAMSIARRAAIAAIAG